MSVQSDTALSTFQNWTLRVRASTNASPRLLLLIHGLSGDENSMWVFVRNFPPDYWVMAPRAPYIAEQGGYSWRLLQAGPEYRPSLEDLRPSAEALLSLVDEYAAQNKLGATQFDVMGFSQGAVMSNALALMYPERIRRAAILSGFVPAGAESLMAKHLLNGKPFFVAHGTQDETVRIERARESVQLLERAGANVTYCEDEVGHKVSANCLRALEKFFS